MLDARHRRDATRSACQGLILLGSAPVAQWTEHRPSKPMVVGSNPTGGASGGRPRPQHLELLVFDRIVRRLARGENRMPSARSRAGARSLVWTLVLVAFLVPPTLAEGSPASVEVTEFRLGAGEFFPRSIAPFRKEFSWSSVLKGQVGQSVGSQRPQDLIDRITPDGRVTVFTPPSPGAGALVAGPLDSIGTAAEPVSVGSAPTVGSPRDFPRPPRRRS